MDLFDYMKETTLENESPLASRMRPTTLEEVVGQEHIILPVLFSDLPVLFSVR